MTTQDALERSPAVVDAFAVDAAAVTRALTVDPTRGLSAEEAVRRRAVVGDNTAPSPKAAASTTCADSSATDSQVAWPSSS